MISFPKIIHIVYLTSYFVHTDVLLNHRYETKVVAVIFFNILLNLFGRYFSHNIGIAAHWRNLSVVDCVLVSSCCEFIGFCCYSNIDRSLRTLDTTLLITQDPAKCLSGKCRKTSLRHSPCLFQSDLSEKHREIAVKDSTCGFLCKDRNLSISQNTVLLEAEAICTERRQPIP